jgi:hypothetical protein
VREGWNRRLRDKERERLREKKEKKDYSTFITNFQEISLRKAVNRNWFY